MTAGGGSWTATGTGRPAATGRTASPGCSGTVVATATWIRWTATAAGPRSRGATARPATAGTSISTATATWTAGTTASSTTASASFDRVRRTARGGRGNGKKTAGEALPPGKSLTGRHRLGARSARRVDHTPTAIAG